MSVTPFEPITREKAARLLSVSLGTLDHMIETGVLPPPRSIGGRRVYWHPDIFYGCLDQLLRADNRPAGVAESIEILNPRDVSKSKHASGSAGSTDLRSVQNAQDRDAARLAELNQ
jgi:DNA-binding transcriptional MerR regulator